MKRKLITAWTIFGILVLILVCFLLTGCAQSAPAPETEWDKTFGGIGGDKGRSVQQTQDGGYIIVGETEQFELKRDAWLVKTDSSGNLEWDKTFGGAGVDKANSVQQTKDGGYIIAGWTESYGAGSSDAWLIKADSSGNLEWDKAFGGPNDEGGMSVQQTKEGGYIIASGTNSFGAGEEDVWLIKTDSSGNKEWDKTFGGSGGDGGVSIQQTQGGGYIIVGMTESYGAGESDVWLVKSDSSGNLEWDKTFGGSDEDGGWSVQQTKEGGYIIAGLTASFRAGTGDVWLVKTDSDGNKEWDKTFGGSNGEGGLSVQQTEDGGYIIVALTKPSRAGPSDTWLIKTDSDGNKEWDKTFGGSNDDEGWSVQQTQDGGYIIAGWTASFGAGDEDVWLVKVSAAMVED